MSDVPTIQQQCQFGLCRREAELRVMFGDADLDVLVCGLHVGPLLSWGLPEPAEGPVIHILRQPAS